LFVGLLVEIVHQYLRFRIANLFKTLKIMLEATLDPPSRRYLCDIGEQITRFYRFVMKGCCAVVDGSLHQLEYDAEANAFQINLYFHLDYNGWKGQICKKGLYFFSLDGCICNFI
jgi:hypothetical protein